MSHIKLLVNSTWQTMWAAGMVPYFMPWEMISQLSAIPTSELWPSSKMIVVGVRDVPLKRHLWTPTCYLSDYSSPSVGW